MKRSRVLRLFTLSLSNGLACFLANVMAIVVFLLTPSILMADIGPHVWSEWAEVIPILPSDSCSPCLVKEMIIDPYAVKEGEEQFFSVWAADTEEVELMTVSIKTKEEGLPTIAVFHLRLVEGTKKEGRWEGSWQARNISYRPVFLFLFKAFNKNGGSASKGMGCCSVWPGGKGPNPEWMNFNSRNSGLLNNRIRALTFDNQGILWIGTSRGLGRFDGVNWVFYTRDNSGLPGNLVTAIAIDVQGNKWIATADLEDYVGTNGLTKFDGKNWTTYYPKEQIVYDSGAQPVPMENSINALAFDSQGNLWAATYCGFSVFDGTNWTLYTGCSNGIDWVMAPKGEPPQFIPPLNVIVRDVISDAKGNIWFILGGGQLNALGKFDGENWTKSWSIRCEGECPINYFTSLGIDPQENLWIGISQNGAAKFDGNIWTGYNSKNSGLMADDISALAIEPNGNIWAGAIACDSRYALYKYDGNQWQMVEAFGLSNAAVSAIAIDSYGNKWIGTGYGLSVYREGGVILNNPAVSVKEKDNAEPSVFVLSQNYPNPFNPRTEIAFGLPEDSHITLAVFNSLGQQIAVLVDEQRQAGQHRVAWDGAGFPNGVYFYRLSAKGFAETRKMLLLK